MKPQLQGRTALITGASRGIGQAMAELFAQEGARVALVARSATDLDTVAERIVARGGSAITIPADLTQDESADQIAEAAMAGFGQIDIVVNNAGGSSFMSPLADLRMAGWHKTMTLNLDATLRVIQATLPHLHATGNGSIVNVSSVTALRASPFLGHYGAAKAAVVSLTQSLAVELGDTGVRANALVPGWVDTDLTEFLRVDPSMETTVIDRVPMRRWGRPEEIAGGPLPGQRCVILHDRAVPDCGRRPQCQPVTTDSLIETHSPRSFHGSHTHDRRHRPARHRRHRPGRQVLQYLGRGAGAGQGRGLTLRLRPCTP